MLVLVNYATGDYKKTQKLNSWTGKHVAGFDRVIECDESFLGEDFKEKNKRIFSYRNGLFLWKPYCILKVLEDLNFGDILFYCDSGAFFVRNIRKYLEDNVDDIWVSDIPFVERQFSNIRAFEIIGCDINKYGDTNQIQATFLAVRKSKETVEFIKTWLGYCCNEEVMIATDGFNDSSFYANREDQTALSLLCKREGIIPYPDPTQYGKLPELYMRDSRYIFSIPNKHYKRKLFIILHRTPRVDIRICMKQLLSAIIPRIISIGLLKLIRN